VLADTRWVATIVLPQSHQSTRVFQATLAALVCKRATCFDALLASPCMVPGPEVIANKPVEIFSRLA
jgi:hypothetical protein